MHDALEAFSTHEKLNVSVLLKDQYDSGGAQHLPGEEDPLESLSVDYDEENIKTKQKRMKV